jgi:hypothetical protein
MRDRPVMRATHIVPLCVVLGAAISVGCSATVAASPEGADADTMQAATAIVTVQRTFSFGAEVGTARADAVGSFVQMRSGSVDDQALHLVRAAVDLPAKGGCTALAQTWSAETSAPARPVYLADVGAISLETGNTRTNLSARQQPDVADLVSGVRYFARPTDAALLPAGGKYVLHVAGASGFDPFDVTAAAPADLGDVRVAGQDAAIGITLGTNDAAIDISWEPGSADDAVFVDVKSRDPNVPVLRCLFPDAGHASLAAWSFGGIEDGTLSLHRLHRESFRAHGIESGEIRFDFARVISFTRR